MNMKLKVVKTFRDKTDHVTVYEPGTILAVTDKKRASDLVKRGLCKEFKGKDAASVTLGEEAPAEEPGKTEITEGGDNLETKTEE